MNKDLASATLTVSTIDGKTQTSLVTSINLTNQNCFPPAVQFSGETVIAQYCVPPGADAGTTTEMATIAAFTAPTFAPVSFGSTFQPQEGPAFLVNPAGTAALLVNPGTGLSLYPLAGGTPSTIDPKGISGLFTPTGDILYTTTGGALVRYTATSGTTTTLVSSGLAFPLNLSPDGNWLQAADQQDSTSGLTDLYLVSATTPGPANAVVKTPSTSALGFSADSNFSVFGTNFPQDFGAAAYTLEASKTAGGAAAKNPFGCRGAAFHDGVQARLQHESDEVDGGGRHRRDRSLDQRGTDRAGHASRPEPVHDEHEGPRLLVVLRRDGDGRDLGADAPLRLGVV